MKNESSSRLVAVATGTYSQATMIQLILENEGIKTTLKDEFLGTIAPHLASPGGAGPVKVLVLEEDLQRALEIMKEIEKSRKL